MTFKELLEAYGLTMAELNRRYDIPRRTMEDWKAGKRNPPDWALTLLKIALDK